MNAVNRILTDRSSYSIPLAIILILTALSYVALSWRTYEDASGDGRSFLNALKKPTAGVRGYPSDPSLRTAQLVVSSKALGANAKRMGYTLWVIDAERAMRYVVHVNSDVYYRVDIGDKVTGRFWRDNLARIEIDGISSDTEYSPLAAKIIGSSDLCISFLVTFAGCAWLALILWSLHNRYPRLDRNLLR